MCVRKSGRDTRTGSEQAETRSYLYGFGAFVGVAGGSGPVRGHCTHRHSERPKCLAARVVHAREAAPGAFPKAFEYTEILCHVKLARASVLHVRTCSCGKIADCIDTPPASYSEALKLPVLGHSFI